MSKGRVTIPTDESFVEGTKKIAELWGADAVRDCDGTVLPANAAELADKEWNVAILRYFNPVGAYESGLIGEDPKGIPNNLMPYVAQVATGKLERIGVFGNDYPTPDGTGVRDYIHVVDLARGHVAAIKEIKTAGAHIYNLGTGNGYSVLNMISAFEKACGKTLPYKILGRRDGDIAACYACADKAAKELKWKARFNLEDMCSSQWNWQKNNPNGYEK